MFNLQEVLGFNMHILLIHGHIFVTFLTIKLFTGSKFSKHQGCEFLIHLWAWVFFFFGKFNTLIIISWLCVVTLDILIRLTSVLACKAFSSSIPLVEVQALASHLCLWSVCLLTMARNPNWSSPSTQHLRLQQLWLNLTTPF